MSAAAARLSDDAPASGVTPSVAEARADLAAVVRAAISVRRHVVADEQHLPIPALDRLHTLLTGHACRDLETLRRLDVALAVAVGEGARAAREGR